MVPQSFGSHLHQVLHAIQNDSNLLVWVWNCMLPLLKLDATAASGAVVGVPWRDRLESPLRSSLEVSILCQG